jgi:NAD(P)-dependent dehydrogenase (short-subunit alcohol dehydrogenase family)
VTTVAVVTGASAGIGRAVARALAERGTSVALLARPSARLDEARLEAEREGVNALAIGVDVADAAAVEAAVARTETDLGPIDLWVNNAMTSIVAPLEQVEPEEFRRVTEVTYLGSVWGTMAALRRMRPRDRGVVVQWDRRSRIGGSPSSPPTAGRSTRSRGSSSRSVRSSPTTGAPCESRWFSCPR